MRVELRVKGMTCKSCEMLIGDEVTELDGVTHIKVDHKKGMANVDFDESKVSLDKIKEVIKGEGYSVE